MQKGTQTTNPLPSLYTRANGLNALIEKAKHEDLI